jgi:hypothetical protein
MNEFQTEMVARINAVPADSRLCDAAAAFLLASTGAKYSYNFS